MAKITKTFVDKVQPPASGYAVHWDDSVKGYGLRVSSQGKRVFIAMGRVLGKPIQFTLGPYGVLTRTRRALRRRGSCRTCARASTRAIPSEPTKR